MNWPRNFNIGKTQASDILKRKAEILDEFESNMDIDRKRKRHKSVHSDFKFGNLGMVFKMPFP